MAHTPQHGPAAPTSAPHLELAPELQHLSCRSGRGLAHFRLCQKRLVLHAAVCHHGSNPLQRMRGKKGPFLHLQRHLLVSYHIVKLTIFKCFVTSVILQLPTRQKVILPLLASLNTVCSAVNHPVRGAKSQRRTSRNSSSSSQLDRPQNGSEQRAGDLQAACTKYLEKHLLDFKLHILVQNMKAMCASEGFKWPMKLTRFLSIELPRDQKLLEG